MVVELSRSQAINVGLIKRCKAASKSNSSKCCSRPSIPVVDLSDASAKSRIVEACTELGFFKVINHSVSMELLSKLEGEAIKFFKLPKQQKEKLAGAASPFGYGSKTIGLNGDVGWIEYLLFSTINISHDGVPQELRGLVKEYVSAVREMACSVLEMIAEELDLGARDLVSRLIRDEKSDSCFRVNHYPACPVDVELRGRSVVGFGEHTDPQIISVLRSNNASGLQICDREGGWVSVPPDHTTFFINVGDSLQVMTNGRFRSVKHRVVADSFKARLSMIYFGGAPLAEKITPLSGVMEEGEESLYKEFTWSDYKKSAYNTRLGDNRLITFLAMN